MNYRPKGIEAGQFESLWKETGGDSIDVAGGVSTDIIAEEATRRLAGQVEGVGPKFHYQICGPVDTPEGKRFYFVGGEL